MDRRYTRRSFSEVGLKIISQFSMAKPSETVNKVEKVYVKNITRKNTVKDEIGGSIQTISNVKLLTFYGISKLLV